MCMCMEQRIISQCHTHMTMYHFFQNGRKLSGICKCLVHKGTKHQIVWIKALKAANVIKQCHEHCPFFICYMCREADRHVT